MKTFVALLFVAIVAVAYVSYVDACRVNGDCHHGNETTTCSGGDHPICVSGGCTCTNSGKRAAPTCQNAGDCTCSDTSQQAFCTGGHCHCAHPH